MANYSGTYYSELGFTQKLTKLQVFSVIDGSRGLTSVAEDDKYLPPIFKSSTTVIAGGFKGCDYSLGRMRFAKLFINATDFLHVDLPFLPGSTEYNQFFISAGFNADIVTVGIEGELISKDGLMRRVLNVSQT